MSGNYWKECWGLIFHLLFAIFLHCVATFMVVPPLTDITMAALCPGVDECDQAIYLTGLEHMISGIGIMLAAPIIGVLSDQYGRKALLMIPMTVTIVPIGVLAYSRAKAYVYAYIVLRTITASVSDVHFLALAYAADNIPEHSRTAAFGVITGVVSCAHFLGITIARLLPAHIIFLVATLIGVFAAVYLRAFLAEPKFNSSCLPGTQPVRPVKSTSFWSRPRFTCSWSSVQDAVHLFKRSSVLTHITFITFFNSLGDAGLQASLLIYLKARFHFEKNQYADLLLIAGVAGAVSQFLLMPLLAHPLGEHKLLCIGLFACFAHAFLNGIAWSSWVPYAAASTEIFFVFIIPCVGSIVSKEVGTDEQGKAQGCVSAIRSFTKIISPLIMTPLTALFLGDKAPFDCPGFSLIFTAFIMMIAFVQACLMRPPSTINSEPTNHMQVLSLEDEQATLDAALLSSSS